MFVPAIFPIKHSTGVSGRAAGFVFCFLDFLTTVGTVTGNSEVAVCIEFLADFAFSVGKNVNDDAKWHLDARPALERPGAGR